MPISVVDALVFESLVAVIAVVTTFALRTYSWREILPVFVVATAAGVALLFLGVDSYPFSDVIVLSFALAGGSLLGMAVVRQRYSYFVILGVAALLDVLSFVLGAQGSGSTARIPVAEFYLDFIVVLGNGSSAAFKLGVVDVLFVSASTMFFTRRQVTLLPLLILGVVSLDLGLAFAWISSGGLPLLPFILAAVLGFEAWKRTTRTSNATRTPT